MKSPQAFQNIWNTIQVVIILVAMVSMKMYQQLYLQQMLPVLRDQEGNCNVVITWC